MSFWAALKRRYDQQRQVHHEWRTACTYPVLGFVIFCLIVALVFFFETQKSLEDSWQRFEDSTGIVLNSFVLAQSRAIIDQAFAAPLYRKYQPKYRVLGTNVVANANKSIFPCALVLWLLASLGSAFAYCWQSAPAHSTHDRRVSLIHWALLMFGIVAIAGADCAENYYFERMLATSNAGGLPWLRLFAQTKFILLATVSLGTLIAFVIGLRREIRFWTRARENPTALAPADLSAGLFDSLIVKEQSGIVRARGRGLVAATVRPEAAGEPWVYDCKEDFVGLALSGGGIRSATFNLGLLQGLHRLNLLRHFDYLTTVSGGGYIGSFWSRWLVTNAANIYAPDEPFPDKYKESLKDLNGDSREFEAGEIRHIREFGAFLVPRTGIFDSETWGAIVAVLAGLVPGLFAALAVLGLSLIVWLMFTFHLACPDPWARVVFAIAMSALVLIGMEMWWRALPTGENNAFNQRRVEIRTAVALILIGLVASMGADDWKVWMYSIDQETWYWRITPANYQNWWSLMGIVDPTEFSRGKLVWIPQLYQPSLGWLTVAAIFMIVRFRGAFALPSMSRRVVIPTNDRVAMRLLGLSTTWALLATFWHIGLNLRNYEAVSIYLGGAAAGSAGLFALLRNWITQEPSRPQKSSTLDVLKPYVPQVLAYSAITLAWAALASLLIDINQQDWFNWYLSAIVLALPILLILIVDPQEFGLHGVYRDRICRAFIGAANSDDAAANRMTDLSTSDDVPLSVLLERPLHLICCAANNIGGDHLSTLSRGAKSAALSRNGVAVNGHWLQQPALTLGSAATASAAAVNTNMGSLSMKVGPAVSFLMAALNLRLGLWVDNPLVMSRPRQDHLLPGWRYFKEMFAWTDTTAADIHLSDGGHFDNLGLYELVRRHCRYIIVSDATADPDVAFDDFGNTTRRIREDFGIEIEIDIEPLKPKSDGISRQHAVVGTIDYGWFDKGILIYIKPSLTGDEPVDTTQYKSRNSEFPHEGTGDQFYDEAQWESYRKLGLHVASKIFAFTDGHRADDPARIQSVFSTAKQIWYPAPPTLADAVRDMSERFTELEKELSTSPPPIFWEVFPELDTITATRSDRPTNDLGDLSCILRVQTLMENTVVACFLNTHWNHPLNLGWVNVFARWATAPTFRRWWPVLRPMYSPDLRKFLEERFQVLESSARPQGRVFRVNPHRRSVQSGLAYRWWAERDTLPDLTDLDLYEYRLTLPAVGDKPEASIQLALVAIDFKSTSATAKWSSDHFFVPLSLWGSGLGTGFLYTLLSHLEIHTIRNQAWTDHKISRCVVEVQGPTDTDGSKATWDERQGFVDFYRQAGFRTSEIKEYEEPTRNGSPRRGRTVILTREIQAR